MVRTIVKSVVGGRGVAFRRRVNDLSKSAGHSGALRRNGNLRRAPHLSGCPMKALELSPGNWAAVDRGVIVGTGFLTNEAAKRPGRGLIATPTRVALTLIGATECETRLRWRGLRLAAKQRSLRRRVLILS
jgi:hypothetical protein